MCVVGVGVLGDISLHKCILCLFDRTHNTLNELVYIYVHDDIDGLVQDCSISIANVLDILQSCTKSSTYHKQVWDFIMWCAVRHSFTHLLIIYQITISMLYNIIGTSHNSYHASNQQQLDCLFNSRFSLTTKKSLKSHHNGQVIQKAFL